MNDKQQQTHLSAFTSKLKIHYTVSNFVVTNSHLQYYHPSISTWLWMKQYHTNVLAKHAITANM